MAGPGDDVAVRLLPVLAQRRGRARSSRCSRSSRSSAATEIEELARQTEEKPFLRAGQKALAEHVTTLVHGAEETAQVQAAAAALFGGGDLDALSASTLGAALREAGSATVAGEIPVVRRPDGRDRAWPRAAARPAGPSPRAAPTSTTSGSRTPTWCRPRATSWAAPGWCCAAARRPSRAWRSPRFELGRSDACLVFPLSPGCGGRQDQSVGPPAPGDYLSRRITVTAVVRGARTSHGATPDGSSTCASDF